MCMFYHVITHTACNLSCKYCDRDDFGPPDEETYDYNVPSTIQYNIGSLHSLVTKDDYVTFYGGEPLLGMDEVRNIMDNVVCKGFMIQTNGLLLHRLGLSYVNRFHTILVSIDGDAESTDKNRGKGIHKAVMDNVRFIKEQGFNGELIARMTITQGSSVYNQVRWLIDNGFDNVHWQLDAMFYEGCDNNWLEDYNKEITQLLEYWFSEMKKGKVLRLYPFLVVMDSMLRGEKSRLRCGSGFSNYTITPNGNIAPCPIMANMKKYYCGDIENNELKKMSCDNEPCSSCEVLDLCGGRCLYVNLTQKGGNKAYEEVCKTVKHLISSLQMAKPMVKDLIEKEIIRLEDFFHLKYNGVEVIP